VLLQAITTSLSKKSLRAAEQERADVARARQRWMREQGMFDPAHLVFVDETAANTKMVRLSGRCPRGERLIGRVPQGHWKTITFVAALRRNGMRGSRFVRLQTTDASRANGWDPLQGDRRCADRMSRPTGFCPPAIGSLSRNDAIIAR
jgi:hypothetical protein